MIVRIMEEGQFRLDDATQLTELNQLDEELHNAAHTNDNVEFTRVLGKLVAFIRGQGQPVPYSEIIPSDLVVPAEDMTLADARALLTPDSDQEHPATASE